METDNSGTVQAIYNYGYGLISRTGVLGLGSFLALLAAVRAASLSESSRRFICYCNFKKVLLDKIKEICFNIANMRTDYRNNQNWWWPAT